MERNIREAYRSLLNMNKQFFGENERLNKEKEASKQKAMALKEENEKMRLGIPESQEGDKWANGNDRLKRMTDMWITEMLSGSY